MCNEKDLSGYIVYYTFAKRCPLVHQVDLVPEANDWIHTCVRLVT